MILKDKQDEKLLKELPREILEISLQRNMQGEDDELQSIQLDKLFEIANNVYTFSQYFTSIQSKTFNEIEFINKLKGVLASFYV